MPSWCRICRLRDAHIPQKHPGSTDSRTSTGHSFSKLTRNNAQSIELVIRFDRQHLVLDRAKRLHQFALCVVSKAWRKSIACFECFLGFSLLQTVHLYSNISLEESFLCWFESHVRLELLAFQVSWFQNNPPAVKFALWIIIDNLVAWTIDIINTAAPAFLQAWAGMLPSYLTNFQMLP